VIDAEGLACGEKVNAGVAVCKPCGAILAAEKAPKHGLSAGTVENGESHGFSA
jgi:hypothetical protein